MPLFEYACRSCEHEFEALVRGHDTPECPSCRSQSLERRQSGFVNGLDVQQVGTLAVEYEVAQMWIAM